jgi:hypothetical protein
VVVLRRLPNDAVGDLTPEVNQHEQCHHQDHQFEENFPDDYMCFRIHIPAPFKEPGRDMKLNITGILGV